jgi:hypothetical protein
MRRLPYITAFFVTFLLLASSALHARASENPQSYITPTPGPDGRIIYVVQEGQNCTMIQNITGIPISQLRSLNQLDENCTLRVGQQLLIGMGGPAAGTATPIGSPVTATPIQAFSTAIQGEANVCVLLYDDLNGDALHQDTENTIPNGAVSVTGTSGQYSKTANTTSGTDPICFEKVIPGTYNISVAAPEGYNPTTQLNYTLNIKAGEQIYVDFGAQQGGKAKPQDPISQPASSNLLGIAGGILVITAIALGIYGWVVYGRRTNYKLKK